MPRELLFLDTNIPIYAAGRPGEYKGPCSRVLRKVKDGELSAAIDAEVVQEILYRYHRIGLDRDAVEISWNLLRLRLKLLPITRKDIESSISFYSKYSPHGIPPRDTLHLAVMLNNGISKIISVDRHFGETIKEVQRIDPRGL